MPGMRQCSGRSTLHKLWIQNKFLQDWRRGERIIHLSKTGVFRRSLDPSWCQLSGGERWEEVHLISDPGEVVTDPGEDGEGVPVTSSSREGRGQPPADQPHRPPPALPVQADQRSPGVPVTRSAGPEDVSGTDLARRHGEQAPDTQTRREQLKTRGEK